MFVENGHYCNYMLAIINKKKCSSTFERLLTKDNSVSIHDRNLQVLTTEMFKVYAEQGPDILQGVFPINSQPEYNLRNKTHFATRPIRTVHYGDSSLRYLGPVMGANTIRYERHRAS